jgi:hypothetical protein
VDLLHHNGIVSHGVKETSTKPPVMTGGFDLYAVQLKTYLTSLSLWGVVDGSNTRQLFDVEGQLLLMVVITLLVTQFCVASLMLMRRWCVMRVPRGTCESASRTNRPSLNMQITFSLGSHST